MKEAKRRKDNASRMMAMVLLKDSQTSFEGSKERWGA